ncbi:3',5'-cyclic-nucleotide phosphodiesterase pde1 [Elasticomyces elasticus]|nr:3',5'-cyclic-nucleotide phosphodiesterase pde1 [Elasticomyces elasticus]
MKDNGESPVPGHEPNGKEAAIQVICLGSGGGPSEDDVTGLLVRSTATQWANNSLLAVDAGTHLASITRILQNDFPLISQDPKPCADSNGNGHDSPKEDSDCSSSASPEESLPQPTVLTSGPFAGLSVPHSSARANAADIVRNHVSTYLITHPHLDHLSGFAVNTAAFHATSRPKRLAALPFTVNAVKSHIFNDVIWPNLTDEDGGVGFVTFQRMAEGGNVMVGEGEGRGYIEVTEGLAARGFGISHGNCVIGPPEHVHSGFMSHDAGTPGGHDVPGRKGSLAHIITQLNNPTRRFSIQGMAGSPGSAGGGGAGAAQNHVVDSTAFFIRTTSVTPPREILVFGDVEPDSISESPRTHIVWSEAAPRIASGTLNGIFIECSYDDSQPDNVLFGHLAPRHLIAEMRVLADHVREAKRQKSSTEANGTKRKRASLNGVDGMPGAHAATKRPSYERKRSKSLSTKSSHGAQRKSFVVDANADGAGGEDVVSPTAAARDALPARRSKRGGEAESAGTLPLEGVKVVIIHVKDTLKDGPHVSERILRQLTEHEAGLRKKGEGLGCEFVVSESGRSYWF